MAFMKFMGRTLLRDPAKAGTQLLVASDVAKMDSRPRGNDEVRSAQFKLIKGPHKSHCH